MPNQTALHTGPGDDEVIVPTGVTAVYTGAGDDHVYADIVPPGPVIIRLGAGNDYSNISAAGCTILGGQGDDAFTAMAFAGVYFGGRGRRPPLYGSWQFGWGQRAPAAVYRRRGR